MSCLADEVIAAWLDGEVAEQERAVAIEHASSCDSCRELVGAMFVGERSPVTIGRYEVIGTIGGGGMGVVLRGRDPVLDRSVAIKLARAGIDDQAQMLREAQALARLSHPNVVAVHDFGESGGEVFVAMALVEGIPLSRWLADPHSLDERVRVLDGVAAGLAAIHDAGLVHRDIKPDNIVVRPSGEAAIVDFGLARPSAPGAVGTGVAGTREYVAPEVLAGGSATPASDQYAWWILVGDVLAERDSPTLNEADVVRDSSTDGDRHGSRADIVRDSSTGRGSRADIEHGRLSARRRARVDNVRALGTSRDPQARFRDLRDAAHALQRALASRWRVPVAIGAGAVVAAVILFVAMREGEDPCAWSPSAWSAQRGAVASGLGLAGVDVDRVLAAVDKRATTTATLRHQACTLARRDSADDRAIGQYRLACIDGTWSDATGHFRGLSSRDREEVWAALDQLGLVLDPARCAKSSRAIAAPVTIDPNAEVTRLGRELVAIARDASIDSATRLARMDAMGPAILATKYAQLEARWHVLRASQIMETGKLDEAAAALDRGELAAERSGDDDLRSEIAINRLAHAYTVGNRDTAALEARAVALVDKLDNPVRRAELADTRGMLLVARGEIAAAVASMREAVTFYEKISLDASERQNRALQNLGAATQMTGDLEAAAAVYDQGIAVSRRRFGENSSEAWEMRGARATNLLTAGRIEDARRELALVVEGMEKLGGSRERGLGMAYLMLCQAETEAKAASAVERCHAALANAEAAFGASHPQLVAYLTLYGHALRTNDRAKEAIEVLARAIAIAQVGTIDATELAYAHAYFALAVHAVDAKDPRGRASAAVATKGLAARPDAATLVKELATAFP